MFFKFVFLFFFATTCVSDLFAAALNSWERVWEFATWKPENHRGSRWFLPWSSASGGDCHMASMEILDQGSIRSWFYLQLAVRLIDWAARLDNWLQQCTSQQYCCHLCYPSSVDTYGLLSSTTTMQPSKKCSREEPGRKALKSGKYQLMLAYVWNSLPLCSCSKDEFSQHNST